MHIHFSGYNSTGSLVSSIICKSYLKKISKSFNINLVYHQRVKSLLPLTPKGHEQYITGHIAGRDVAAQRKASGV